jgi:CrcB protein
MLLNLLFVAAGSAVGGVARYLIGLGLEGRSGWMPLGTLVVNVLGGLLIGIVVAVVPATDRTRLLLATGFCGGFTTFSAFSRETLELVRRDAIGAALANIALNVVLSIGACWLGWRLGTPR